MSSPTTSAQITSDGSSATQLGQIITSQIQPDTTYALTFSAKVSSLDASGVVTIQLTNENGTVIQNDAGNNLSYTRNTNGQITTSGWTQFTVFFSTPRQLPTTVNVQVGLTTAMAATKSLYLDLVAVTPAIQMYTQGPFVAAFSYTLRTAIRDNWSVVFTNSLTTKSFVLGMQRLYNMRQLGEYLPSSGSPTISDSLVTN